MISWIVVLVLVIIGIIAIRLNHLRHRIFIILLILLALFLYTSMALIVEKNNLDLRSSDGIFSAIKVYSGWLANGFENLKEITGKIIKMDWASTDGKFFDDSKKSKK